MYIDTEKAFELVGGSIRYYNSGYVSSVSLPGVHLSHTKARGLRGIYYDAVSKKWNLTGDEEVDAVLAPALNKILKD